MRDFQVIQHLLADVTRNCEDPPADNEQQQLIRQMLTGLLGQSANFLHPTLFSSGCLLLIAQAPIWASHIRHRQQSIIDQAQQHGIEISEIKVKVIQDAVVESKPSTRDPSLSQAAAPSIEKTAQQVNEPALKAALLRLHKRVKNQSEKTEK